MGYANAGCEEHDCAVGVETLVAAVWTFTEGGYDDALVGGGVDFFVEAVCEAISATDD